MLHKFSELCVHKVRKFNKHNMLELLNFEV